MWCEGIQRKKKEDAETEDRKSGKFNPQHFDKNASIENQEPLTEYV